MQNVKKIIWLLAIISFTVMNFAQTGWVLQTNPLGANNLLGKVQLVGSTEIWISENQGRLLHSTNNGTNWTIVNPFPDDTIKSFIDPANSMWWVNKTHGWHLNYLGTSQNNAHGVVINKTTDGGITWQKKVLSTTAGDVGIYIQFINENIGWVLIFNLSGISASLLRTTDGGNNWSPVGTTGGMFYFVDANNGWIITSSSSMGSAPPYYISHTTDGGANWSVQYTDNTKGKLSNLQFTDLNNGWAVGDSAKILKTTNGGNNWIPITNTGNNAKNEAVFFINANVGWIGSRQFSNQGQAVILHTTDGGGSWSIQNTPSQYKIFSIYFADVNNGWFTADFGVIGHTANGGATEVEAGNNIIPTRFSLSQNYPNPFNPTTTIDFSIPKACLVTLKIYDMLGREIKTLVDENKVAGSYNVKFDALLLTSGIYFYQLQADNFIQTKKIVFIK